MVKGQLGDPQSDSYLASSKSFLQTWFSLHKTFYDYDDLPNERLVVKYSSLVASTFLSVLLVAFAIILFAICIFCKTVTLLGHVCFPYNCAKCLLHCLTYNIHSFIPKISF
jgi:hypothetical protein